jgi:hypothetical protein
MFIDEYETKYTIRGMSPMRSPVESAPRESIQEALAFAEQMERFDAEDIVIFCRKQNSVLVWKKNLEELRIHLNESV